MATSTRRPCGPFPPNRYGLFEMTGYVWEWTVDWYQDHRDGARGRSRSADGHGDAACCTVERHVGADRGASIDPRDPARVPRKVMKGGSHLCAPN